MDEEEKLKIPSVELLNTRNEIYEQKKERESRPFYTQSMVKELLNDTCNTNNNMTNPIKATGHKDKQK